MNLTAYVGDRDGAQEDGSGWKWTQLYRHPSALERAMATTVGTTGSQVTVRVLARPKLAVLDLGYPWWSTLGTLAP